MTHRVGPLKWTRRCALDEIERLNYPDSHSDFGWDRHGDALFVDLSHSDRTDAIELARHYPKDWLLQVAVGLAECINQERLKTGTSPVQVVSETAADRLQQPTAEQPANSRIRVRSLSDGVIVRVPPAGLLQHAGGAGAMCGVMGVGTLVVTGIAVFNLDVLAPFAVFFGLLTLFLFAVYMAMWNGAQRRTVLTVTPDRLKVEQTAPFGSRQQEWKTDEIDRVEVGPSDYRVGSTTDKRHLPELQIHPREGERFGLFPARDEDELRWLVTLLQKQLQLPDSG